MVGVRLITILLVLHTVHHNETSLLHLTGAVGIRALDHGANTLPLRHQLSQFEVCQLESWTGNGTTEVLMSKSSILCSAEGLNLKALIRKKRQECQDGMYDHNGMQCCLCPAGFYVVEHCTQSGGFPKCEVCDEGTYTNKANGEEKCSVCTVCQHAANKETERKCTQYLNTLCRCRKDHYCEKGCDVCHACDTCEGLGVKMPCTGTTNTVCKEPVNTGARIAAVCIVLVLLVLVCIVVFMWKRKILCFRDQSKNDDPDSEEFKPLEAADLSKLLPSIADVLGYRIVKDVARHSLTKVQIETVELDHPSDAKERAVQLLEMWYQNHGMHGAYNTLIQNLIQTRKRSYADKVKSIVQNEQERGDTASEL